MHKHELNPAELTEVINSNDIVIVDYFANWCGPCQMFLPVFRQVGEAREEMFATIDLAVYEEVAMERGIQAFPTIVMYKNGEEVARQMGFMPPEVFEQWVNENK